LGARVITKSDLKSWVLAALGDMGGTGRIVEIAKHIWDRHERDLEKGGDIFYTWQYDMRWVAQELQNEGKISKAGKNRTWFIVS
jgi:hypothetical protein